jgi:hypothetical protein
MTKREIIKKIKDQWKDERKIHQMREKYAADKSLRREY